MARTHLRGGKSLRWLAVMIATALMGTSAASAETLRDLSPRGGALPKYCVNAFKPPTVTPKALSTCTAGPKGNLTIGPGRCGPAVLVDQSFTGGKGFRKITIAAGGQLVFPYDPGYLELDTSTIVIEAGGKLEVGNAECPIGYTNPGIDQIEINFTDPNPAFKKAVKGIILESGGSLQMYGATGVAPKTPAPGASPQAPSWTYLAAPAGPSSEYGAGQGLGNPVTNDATTIAVQDNVNWQPNQWIVVAGTDFSPDGAEFVQISQVVCGGQPAGACTITLNPATPLVNYHFGGAAPDLGAAAFNDGPAKNYGVDERAEVGLISRNVKLTSTITGTDVHNGGEIKILRGYAKIEIQGVEIEKFGKDKKGSYPIHFHMAGPAPAKTLIDSNSIHHSYNHCITVHATSGLTISNNVCARIADHIFYLESGRETNDVFEDNLGIGAMSDAFSIPQQDTAAQNAFWSGDYLARQNGYNGFNIPFTDQTKSVVGSSFTPSGFWITNPGANTFIGNSIAGCQDQGRGFWMLPASTANAQVLLPKDNFKSNRAHGCYTGFDTAEDVGVTGAYGYTPQKECVAGSDANQKGSHCDAITEFDDLTATRNRNRGIWVRASWYDIENARLAANRDSVSLVSSGGTEGSPPGEWSRVNNAIVVGLSTNNPNRFGPCPYNGENDPAFGGVAGCYETIANAGNGYPDPKWNMFGVMFYDGPARIENTKFVNFRKDPTSMLSLSDQTFLNYYESSWSGQKMPCGSTDPFQYEGDAAMGWFQSNLNSYPPTQYTQNVSYENVDLRHEIYTQDVENTCGPTGVGANFRDGDKFTVILDHDATLSGLEVVPKGGGSPISGAYPISLNNLPFLSGPDTVDECHSMGVADEVLENRPTSLISPYSYATLEFSALTCGKSNPPCPNDNVMIFTKDEIDYANGSGDGQIQFKDSTITKDSNVFSIECGGTADPNSPGVLGHACVALSGRNGEGVYEPKLVNGLGYTVQAQKGMPNLVTLMFGDANLPGGISSTAPFQARVGICFKNEGASAPPASAFTVYKGSKSFAGPDTSTTEQLDPYYTALPCNGLDNLMCSTSPVCVASICPDAPFFSAQNDTGTLKIKTQLTAATSVGELEDQSKCPGGTCYYYDQNSGLLFLDMTQEQPNAGGSTGYSSPLGSCTTEQGASDPACAPENFYSCPGPGCEEYTVEASTASYTPNKNPSDCTPYGGAGGATDYTQAYPSGMNQLAYASDNSVVTVELDGATPLPNAPFPHQAATNAPTNLCPTNEPETPDWAPPPSSSIPTDFFNIGAPPTVTVTISPSVPPLPLPSTVLYPLLAGEYTITATATAAANCTPDPTAQNPVYCQCQQIINVSGASWTSSGNNCCQLGTRGGTTIGVAGTPFTCQGP